MADVYLDEIGSERNAKLSSDFIRALASSQNHKTLTDYLQERHVSEDSVKTFEIGYCPERITFPDSLRLLNNLKGRLTFPIKDEYGDVIGFSGRYPRQHKEDESKWWHSAFVKSFFLYGLNVAQEHIIKDGFVIITEGAIDAIACHQNGLKNTVAMLGTALTSTQISKLKRFTSNFVLLFDGDKAGQTAAKSLTGYFDVWNNNAHAENYKYINVNLKTDGKEFDPDTFLLEKGIDQLKKKIKSSKKKEPQHEWV
jgi:DNA primase catalytic core